MNAEDTKAARLNSWDCAWKGRAASRARAVAVAGLVAWASPSRAETGDTFLTEVNRVRAEGVTCPAATYRIQDQYGNIRDETDPAKVFAPGGAALTRNANLDQAAEDYGAAVDRGSAGSGEQGGFVNATGYLPLAQTGSGWRGWSGDEALVVQQLKTDPYMCRPIFSPEYSEVGIGAAGGTFLYVVATPFDATKIKEYAQAVLASVNRRRAAGYQCPGSQTIAKPYPLAWSDGLAIAAQQLSDYAAENYAGGPPHDFANAQGTKQNAQARVAAVPCLTSGVWENVAIFGSLDPTEGWMTSTLGHCDTVMRSKTHAGVGIKASSALVSRGYGPSFVTLIVGDVTGACPGTTSTTQPGTTTQPGGGTAKGATTRKCWEQTQRNPRTVPFGFQAC